MKKLSFLCLCGLLVLLSCCNVEKNKVYDQFNKVNSNAWNWNQGVKFTFTIDDSSYFYDLNCGLRISGSYLYSNIWIVYQLDGPQISRKNQVGITLSDNTGKWLGKGQSNLLSYEEPLLKGAKLKAGTYTLTMFQNMRDENLQSVSDIGLKVIKAGKIY